MFVLLVTDAAAIVWTPLFVPSFRRWKISQVLPLVPCSRNLVPEPTIETMVDSVWISPGEGVTLIPRTGEIMFVALEAVAKAPSSRTAAVVEVTVLIQPT
jgi:hypothetical protein